MEKDSAVNPNTPHTLVTEENLKKVLLADKGKDAHLLSFKCVDFTKKGDNYACFVTSVNVKYSLNEKHMNETYVVKLNPCRKFKDGDGVTEQFFQKELNFYLELVPELNSVLERLGLQLLRFPPCFHGELERRGEQIYLADMRPQGFQMFDKRKGMDPEHASLVLKELGRLHATSLLLEDKTNEALEIKHDYLKKDFLDIRDGSTDIMNTLNQCITSAVGMLKRVGGYEKAIIWAESLRPRLRYILSDDLLSERFNVLNHGDCWNNNLLFRYNEEGRPIDVMMLDLQICRKASLAIDLNYFFYTSFNGDVRKENLKSFLSTYYNSFKNVMEAGGLHMHFTEDELMEEFRSKNTVGGFFGMMVLPIILMESDDIPDMSGNSDEDIYQLMEDIRAKALAGLNTNPIMKPRFLSIFDDFMESGLIP